MQTLNKLIEQTKRLPSEVDVQDVSFAAVMLYFAFGLVSISGLAG